MTLRQNECSDFICDCISQGQVGSEGHRKVFGQQSATVYPGL